MSSEHTGRRDDAIDITPADRANPVPGGDTGARRGRTRLVALGALGALGVVAAATLFPTAIRIVQQKDARLSAPDVVAGLHHDDSTAAVETAEYLRSALTAEIDLDSTVAAVYRDARRPDWAVFVVGGTGLLFTPQRQLDTAMRLVTEPGQGLSGEQDEPAGPLGGTMRCATAGGDVDTMTVCGWADHGSVAIVFAADTTAEELAPLTLQIRTETQRR